MGLNHYEIFGCQFGFAQTWISQIVLVLSVQIQIQPIFPLIHPYFGRHTLLKSFLSPSPTLFRFHLQNLQVFFNLELEPQLFNSLRCKLYLCTNQFGSFTRQDAGISSLWNLQNFPKTGKELVITLFCPKDGRNTQLRNSCEIW